MRAQIDTKKGLRQIQQCQGHKVSITNMEGIKIKLLNYASQQMAL